MKHNPFVPREQRTAILTFDNGQRVRAEITLPGTDKPVWHADLERRIVKASDEQRDKFISDMEKFFGGKYNPDTLQVEPVQPECPFKPFDKVLVRDTDEQAWCANYFSHYKNDPDYFYVCINGIYHYCIPYNEHTAHLLGTTDSYTEGGSE